MAPLSFAKTFSTTVLAEATGQISKPVTDHRDYRFVELPNKLRAVLISDPKCDKSAASLDVRVGSMFDLKKFQGLAHFCEHMLFLGTDKYPDEEEYNKFLAKNGGSSNAFTSDTDTCYFFSVMPSHLEGALDRFAQFFISPQFTQSATDREVQAVHSEHSKNVLNDAWRNMQLLRSLHFHPEHPASHFGTGNLSTLQGIPRQALLDFHEKWYSANAMCLSVIGRESCDDLEAMVRSKFNQISNKNVKVPKDGEFGEAWFARGLGKAVDEESVPHMNSEAKGIVDWVVPVKDIRSVTLCWPLPSQQSRWKTKPTRYISHLVGHEGPGSLLAELKRRNLASALASGLSYDCGGVSLFSIDVTLTAQAASEIEATLDSLIELTLVYLRLCEANINKNLWEEMAMIESMNFKYRSLPDPMSTVQSISQVLQEDYPPDQLLAAPALFYDFDPQDIRDHLTQLVGEALIVRIIGKEFEDRCLLSEEWYGTKYGQEPLESLGTVKQILQKMRQISAQDIGEQARRLNLHLPKQNEFVPENLEFFASEKPSQVLCVDQTENSALFYRQDATFKLPKAMIAMNMFSQMSSISAQNQVLNSIFHRCLTEELTPISYDAEIAGLKYVFSGNLKGSVLQVSGYNDKLLSLLAHIVDVRKGFSPSKDTLALVYDSFLRQLKNSTLQRTPYQQAIELVSMLTVKPYFSFRERLEACENIGGDIENHIHRFCENFGSESLYLESLVQGNILEAEAKRAQEMVGSIGPQGSRKLPNIAVVDIEKSLGCSELVLCQEGTNEQETNGAVVLQIPAGFTCACAREISALEVRESLSAIIFSRIIGQKFFDTLRTKQQLGYIVHAGTSSSERGRFFRFLVQSERPVAEVRRRIDDFVAQIPTLIEDVTGDEFAAYVGGAEQILRDSPKTLAEEFSRHWDELENRRFDFQRRERLIADCENVKKIDIQNLTQKYLVGGKRIYAVITGCNESPEKSSFQNFWAIPEIQEFRKSEKTVWVETNNAPFDEEPHCKM